MVENRYELAKESIKKAFARPRDILDAADLPQDQKIELLNQWKQDLHQLIVASGEGMTARHPGRAAELLRDVEEALNELGA